MKVVSMDDVTCLVEDWKNLWEPKILSYGDRESKSSKSLLTKLSGKSLTCIDPQSESASGIKCKCIGFVV